MRRMRWAAIAAATTAALCGMIPAARADLKLVQTVTVKGMATGGKSSKGSDSVTTVYYKGSSSRTESGGTVTIYEGTSGKFYYLDTRTKTYYEAIPIPAPGSANSDPMERMVDYVGSAQVTDTKEEKTILGKKAHRYRYSVTITPTPKKDIDIPPTVAAAIPSQIPTVEFSGDQWVIDNIGADTLQPSAALLQNIPPGMGAGMKPLIDKMAAIKGVPVEKVEILKVIATPVSSEEIQAAAKSPLVRETKIKTMSEDTLSSALFAVPPDYKKLSNPPTGGL